MKSSAMLGSLAKLRRNIVQSMVGQQQSADLGFERAKQQFAQLEQSVLTIRAEANNYVSALKMLGENGALMMDKIAAMFTNTSSAAALSLSTGAESLSPLPPLSPQPQSPPVTQSQSLGSSEWPDPNESHPYKDVARLMQRTQQRMNVDSIALSVRHFETRLLSKIHELTVKFDALKDRISDRDKLQSEVESLAKIVESNKQKSLTNKKDINSQGEKHFELESQYNDRKEEFDRQHAALVRELQQYNENRLDILSALLLDLFAAQRFFAYDYGRSLWSLHQQLIEADNGNRMGSLPKPSWQALMAYVSETDEDTARTLQPGEPRPSLIMKLASERLDGGGGVRAKSPVQPRLPIPAPSPHRDHWSGGDDVDFNPHLLQDPKNRPYLPLSKQLSLKESKDAIAKAGGSERDFLSLSMASHDEEPGQSPVNKQATAKKAVPLPAFAEPSPINNASGGFSAVHSTMESERNQREVQKSNEIDWSASFDSMASSTAAARARSPPAASPPLPAGRGAEVDFFGGSSFSAAPPPASQPAPPPILPRPNIAPLLPPPPPQPRTNRPAPPPGPQPALPTMARSPPSATAAAASSNPFAEDFDSAPSFPQARPERLEVARSPPTHATFSPPTPQSHASFTPPQPSSQRGSLTQPLPFAPGGPLIPDGPSPAQSPQPFQPPPPQRPPPPSTPSPHGQRGSFGFPPPPPGGRPGPPRGPATLAPGTVKTPFDDD